MTKEFNSLKEIQKYYDEKSHTYIFKENGEYIDLVIFNFDLNVNANIEALNISAIDINAWIIEAKNIEAWDIKALDIKAQDISYYAVCVAYGSIKCKSIKGRRRNAQHLILDGILEIGTMPN